MEAVILAGGFGTRLRPLTYRIPKALVPVAGRPMIMHLIDSLPSEVDKVVMAVSYMRDALESHFKEDPVEGVEMVFVEEREALGTGGAIKNVEKEISGDFLAFNGDIISSVEPMALYGMLKEKSAKAVISLWKVEYPSHYGVVDLGPDMRINRFVEKPAPGEEPSNLISAGAYALSYDVLDLIPSGRVVSLERKIWPILVEKGMYGLPFEGYWTDAGTPERVLEANAILLRSMGKEAIVDENADVRGEVLPYSSIGNAVVKDGAVVENSIVMDGSTVKSGVKVKDCIIGPKMDVKRDCEGEVIA